MAQEKIIEIPLKALTVDYAWNSRTGVGSLKLPNGEGSNGETGDSATNEFSDLVASLEAAGQDTPVDVVEKPEKSGKFFLVTGFRRFRAIFLLAEKNGVKDATIKAIVKVLSPYEAALLNARENTARQNLSAPDTAKALIRLRDMALKDKKEFTHEGLATSLGIGKSYASKLFKIEEQTTPKILKAWHEGQRVVGTDQMYKIAGMGPEKVKEQEEKFAAASRLPGEGTRKHWTEAATRQAIQIGTLLGKCQALGLVEVKQGIFRNHIDKLIKMGVGDRAPTDKQRADIVAAATEAFKDAQEPEVSETAATDATE